MIVLDAGTVMLASAVVTVPLRTLFALSFRF
jgi:hypothetical protein